MEIAQGFQAVFSVIASLLFSTAYMIGGRSDAFLGIRARLWKRVIAPLLLASSAVIFSILAHRFNWATACCIIWFIPIGPGGDFFWDKLTRRLAQSIFLTAPTLIFCISTGSWIVSISQIIVGAFITILWGMNNPKKAPVEEFMIAFSNTFLIGVCLL